MYFMQETEIISHIDIFIELAYKFYQKIGWKIEATYQTPEGREMNRYTYDFGS